VRLLQRCGRETLGVSIQPTTVAGWGDMRHFSLNKPTDCCFYGPGVYGGGMHSPDEYAELDGMLPVSRVLASLVLAWCGSA
jgi:acetylornithine deacetylase/succinyl-diaminopimelate desuccinylase-like protein